MSNRAGGGAYVSFPRKTVDLKTITWSPSGTDLVVSGGMAGKKLLGTNNVTIRVISVGTSGGRATYELKYQNQGEASWHDYCAPGDVAIAQSGSFKNSAFRVTTDRITFGCGKAAMSKCNGWGYVPDNVQMSVASRAFQACTRAARADRCGDGTPGTRPETPIVLRDNIIDEYKPPPFDSAIEPLGSFPPIPGVGAVRPLQFATKFPAPPDQHWYESSWTWRENRGAICFERDRWASVGPETCPGLPDPRIDRNAKICSEMQNDDPFQDDVIITVASQTQDIFIKQWQNPATLDVVSTVRGFWRANRADPPPFPGEGYTDFLGEDGILLRNPPWSLTPNDVTPVYSVTVGNRDRAMLPSTMYTTTDDEFEGYLLKERPEVTRRLKTFTFQRDNDYGNDTMTATSADNTWTEQPDVHDFVLDEPATDVEPLPSPPPVK